MSNNKLIKSYYQWWSITREEGGVGWLKLINTSH